ncbi:MAG: hypothetical protein FD146_2331 [Anaerolineaceae bacterium]|nr:MAG: hypothetical protein FD146_2331 [Anaerolineaceae bacterium]
MENKSAVQNQLFQSIIAEAKRVHEDALFCTAGHTHEARHWDTLQLWLGIPATVIAAVTGITSLASNSASVGILGLNINIITGIFSLLVATISGLATFLDPKGQAAKHYQAVNSYAALLNETRFFYEIDCIQNRDVEKLEANLRKLSERLNDLNNQTPLISTRAAALAEKSILSGNYEYRVDKQSVR